MNFVILLLTYVLECFFFHLSLFEHLDVKGGWRIGLTEGRASLDTTVGIMAVFKLV